MTAISEPIVKFLVEAKLNTYAAQGDDASVTPLLPGSRQLEYGDGPLFYRDVYFGVAYFVGQETVYNDERPCWSMSYAGGVEKNITTNDEMRNTYIFLRTALRQVSTAHVFRGPSEFKDNGFEYKNVFEGDFNSFHGTEVITRNSQVVYTLYYGGGTVR